MEKVMVVYLGTLYLRRQLRTLTLYAHPSSAFALHFVLNVVSFLQRSILFGDNTASVRGVHDFRLNDSRYQFH